MYSRYIHRIPFVAFDNLQLSLESMGFWATKHKKGPTFCDGVTPVFLEDLRTAMCVVIASVNCALCLKQKKEYVCGVVQMSRR